MDVGTERMFPFVPMRRTVGANPASGPWSSPRRRDPRRPGRKVPAVSSIDLEDGRGARGCGGVEIQ